MTPVDPIAVALTVVRALDRLGILSTIGGSLASSVAGEPRSTVDIDIVVALEEIHVAPFIELLGEDFYISEAALRRAVADKTSANLIHQATQLKVDLFVAGGTPLDAAQLLRRQPIQVGTGQVLHVHPPEDILLQKLRWYRRGGETSDRQWRDIQGIIRVQGDRLDEEYLRTHAPVMDVADLLARVLSEGRRQ